MLKIKWWWYRKTHKFNNRTKEDRHKDYVDILNWYVNQDKCGGLCIAMERCGKPYLNALNYPELWVQKPSRNVAYWWDIFDSAPRIKALRNAIKLSK